MRFAGSVALVVLLAASGWSAKPASVKKKATAPAPRDFPAMHARCKSKYAHPMECQALVSIAEGLGMSASDPNSTNLLELREGGWLQAHR